MQIVTQDRKRKFQGLDIVELYTLTDTEHNTYKVKAKLYDDEIVLLGEYETQAEMEHYYRLARYEAAYDAAETIVYM